MTERSFLRAVPTTDRLGLVSALREALSGGPAVLPVPAGQDPAGQRGADGNPAAAQAHADELAAELGELPLGTALVIRTSGSSGVPKAVALSGDALAASAHATYERLGGPGQWLVTLPIHLISGVQMLVRSAIAETEPVYLDGSFDPAAFFAAAATLTHERRYVSLVPVQLSRLLDAAETATAARAREEALAILSRFDAVLVGGQATPLALRSRAHRAGITLCRSYGMSESAGGCVYNGVEIGDTLVRIREGEVQLAGPTLALGYVGNAELTADSFIDDAGTRWYRTGDAGELLGGMLSVTGRLDRVIVSGGMNVSLDEVERVAGEQPGWAGVIAVGVDDPEWGERPLLVRADGASVDGLEEPAPFTEVRAALRRALGAAAAPEREVVLDELPQLAGGKPDRAAIRAQLARG